MSLDRSSITSLLVIALCSLTLLLNNGFMIVGRAFFDPIIIDRLKISVGTLKFGETITYSTIAITAPLAGYLMDRIGPRILFGIGLGLMAAGLALYANAASVPVLYVADAMFGLCLALCGSYAGVIVVSEVTAKRRGTAIGVLLAASNLGNGIAPATYSMLTDAFGWRNALVIVAALTLLLIPVIAIFIPRRLSRMLAAADQEQDPPTFSRTLRSGNFWYLSSVAAIGFMIAIGLFSNMILFLKRDLSMDAANVNLFIMVMYLASFGAQLSAGFIGELVGEKLLDILCILAMAVGALIFQTGVGPQLWVAMILFSIGWGGHYVLLQNFLPRLFAGPSFGRIVGVVALIEALGASAGPFAIGVSYDLTRSYALAFLIGAFALAGTALLAARIRVPTRQPDVAPPFTPTAMQG